MVIIVITMDPMFNFFADSDKSSDDGREPENSNVIDALFGGSESATTNFFFRFALFM